MANLKSRRYHLDTSFHVMNEVRCPVSSVHGKGVVIIIYYYSPVHLLKKYINKLCIYPWFPLYDTIRLDTNQQMHPSYRTAEYNKFPHHQVTIGTHIDKLIVNSVTWERLDMSSLPKHYAIPP